MRNRISRPTYLKYHPVATFILLSLAGVAQADSVSKLTNSVVNGVTVVNINEANEHGVSHNIYNKFNVDKKGLIFNNSQNAIKTTLAGDIQGNSNLTSGAAKVILNEVISKNQSALQGWLEVAGNKAHLIIANPNGISCQGCGFINAEKVTVTTGKPDMQNGMLKGYNVNGGMVTLAQLESASPTEILARSVIVSGKVFAEELAVVTGNNYVDITGKTTGTVKAQGYRQTYGIDVAALGGMYANKIKLVSSEKGVGVRNSGIIAGNADIQIDSSGKIINNNAKIQAAGSILVKAQQGLENITGRISSNNSLTIDMPKGSIDNNRAGMIAAEKDITVSSSAFNNINGKISAGGTLAINTHNNTLLNRGKGDSVGIHATVVKLQTGWLDNHHGLVKGHSIDAAASSLYNNDGTIEATGDMKISSNANIDNRQGLIRSTVGYLHLDVARGSINNGNTRTADTFSGDSQGIIAGEGGININTTSFDNRTGQIASKGDISITATSGMDNYQGKVTGDKNISVKAGSLFNGQAGISSTGNIDVELEDTFANNIGILNSDEGNIIIKAMHVNNKGGIINGSDVNIQVKSTLDNSAALMVANKNLIITAAGMVNNSNAEDFGTVYGGYLAMPNQKGGMVGRENVVIDAGQLNNENSRIVSEFGALAIKSKKNINNALGRIVANSGASQINAQSINNDEATISSKGSMTINTVSLSNYGSGNPIDNDATGIIAADKNLTVNIGSNFVNYGWVNANENASVTVAGIFSNRNVVSAGQDLTITTKNNIYNYRDMAAANHLLLKASANIKNMSGANIKGVVSTAVEAKGELVNQGNIVSDNKLIFHVDKNIYNYSNILTSGSAIIHGKNLLNSGSKAYMGGVMGMELKADNISNSGTFVGL